MNDGVWPPHREATCAGISFTLFRSSIRACPASRAHSHLVANAVQNAMVGPDTTLQGGLVSAATLLAVNAGVARFRLRSARFRQLVEGVPVVLVQRGELVSANLHREGITEDEVVAAVREHGEIGDLSQVELAVLETDGSVSIVPMSANVQRSRRRLRQRRK